MSNVQVFNDRFSYGNPAFAAIEDVVDTLVDTTLESLSPSLKEMANTVRRHSVLLKKKTTKEIYFCIIEHADPRIALVLAAARDKTGLRLFPTLEQVKEAMFGPLSPDDTTFIDGQNNIFVQGIKRVAAALAASVIIGQLAQIPEQAKHADVLETQALADLDRIISVPDILKEAISSVNKLDGTVNQAFFFENRSFSLNSTLNISIFLSTELSPSWISVGSFSGNITTSDIVIAIADAINTQTLVSNQGNIVASPIIDGKNKFHRIEFSARNRDSTIQNELIIVRIVNLENTIKQDLPFKWGTEAEWMGIGEVNSAILTVQQGKTTTAIQNSANRTGNPTVLYFKRAPVNSGNQVLSQSGIIISDATWASTSLIYRISPTQSDAVTVLFERETSADPVIQANLDSYRPSKLALALLNALFINKSASKALGALIRNDDPSSANAMTAIELVAFNAMNPQVWMILDLLQIPSDILVSVGNLNGPVTPFSSLPKTVRVETHYEFRLSATSIDNPTSSGTNFLSKPKVLRLKESSPLKDLFKDATYHSRNFL